MHTIKKSLIKLCNKLQTQNRFYKFFKLQQLIHSIYHLNSARLIIVLQALACRARLRVSLCF
ncbi:hypothetical protein BpHYR1_018279 [Brachionus plicatilis]|uniref:Uncharacterized protein n=1 Tax=Brachionus plicatilis TaxID=10195 RepID=A0A3M7Q6M6_BRAPC|nr:hypothetical protein BpHYR1_018279 [Brachionus plicatilis]